jgi:hypothetical protein
VVDGPGWKKKWKWRDSGWAMNRGDGRMMWVGYQRIIRGKRIRHV